MRPIIEVLTRYGYSIAAPHSAFLEWCLDQGMSGPLLGTIKEGWVERSEHGFGEYGAFLFDPDKVMAEAAEFPQFLRDGFMAIGSAPNGDPIALDIKSGAVVYLSHDELWGYEERNAREYSVEIAPSLNEYGALSVANKVAIDYWEARDGEDED